LEVALRLLGTGACEATHARNVQHPVGYAKLGTGSMVGHVEMGEVGEVGNLESPKTPEI